VKEHAATGENDVPDGGSPKLAISVFQDYLFDDPLPDFVIAYLLHRVKT
jgi:hypothetical protein